MPRVFKKTYTRPIPDGAQRVTLLRKVRGKDVQGPAVRFKGPDGKTITAPLTGAGDRCLITSPTWYGRVPGEAQPVALCANKAAAEIMLGERCRKAEMGQAGAVDPYEAHNRRPLAEHLDDYRRELEARGNAPRYVALVEARLRDLLNGCGFALIPDISASKAADWLARLRQCGQRRPDLDPTLEEYTAKEAGALLGIKARSVGVAVRRARLAATGNGKARRFPRATVEALLDAVVGGVSVETTNQYLRHLKGFCNWLVGDDRAATNPAARLEPGNVEVDRRHDRRELEADELRRLLAAALASAYTFRGLTGPDRFHLYATACGTGFRAAGLASLTPASFDLDADTPTVTLAARKNKSRKPRVQPLPADVAELLRAYLKDRPVGQPVWGGTWALHRTGAEMLRIDLDAAGIPYTVEGPDGPLFADFHALRHTYLTLLGKGGVDLRTAQELAGHSSPVLTARYSHRRLYDLAGAVEKLPEFLPTGGRAEAVRATGTDGAGPGIKDIAEGKAQSACTPLAQPANRDRDSVRLFGTGTGGERERPTGRNSFGFKGVAAGREDSGLIDRKAGDGIRTHDVQLGKLARDDAGALPRNDLRPEAGPACTPLAQIGPDLARVVTAWPQLPEHIKAAVLALISTAGPGQPTLRRTPAEPTIDAGRAES